MASTDRPLTLRPKTSDFFSESALGFGNIGATVIGCLAHWPLEDPAAAAGSDAERTAVFRRIRDEIEVHVRAWLQEQDATH